MSPTTCTQCGTQVPAGAAFCPTCGTPTATAAASPTTPALPTPGPAVPAAEPVSPVASPIAAAAPVATAAIPAPAYAYPVATSAQVAQAMPNKSRKKLFLVLGGGGAVFLLAMLGVLVLVGPGPVVQVCKPLCPTPNPTRPPLGAPHTYISSRYGYQLDYFDNDLTKYGKIVVNSDSSIGWVIGFKLPGVEGIKFPITFSGEAAASRSAQAVVQQNQAAHFPNALLAYPIPGAELGYNDAYGAVYDVNLQSGNGASAHGRLVMITAVKGGVAVNLVSVGPYRRSTQDDGHPNPSDTDIVNLFGAIVNTVRFKGDRPR